MTCGYDHDLFLFLTRFKAKWATQDVFGGGNHLRFNFDTGKGFLNYEKSPNRFVKTWFSFTKRDAFYAFHCLIGITCLSKIKRK